MTQARSAAVQLVYNGVNITDDLSGMVLDVSYTDNAPGMLDDLQISLQDRERRWQGAWEPAEGDTIEATIERMNWKGDGKTDSLPCGLFAVDTFDIGGPPDTAKISASSLIGGSTEIREKRTKAWENVRLRTIAQDIAGRSGLTLLYEHTDNPLYDRIEQTNQADLSFLMEICKREGIALKVASKQLVLFDEYVYEQADPVLTIRRMDTTSYSFSWSAVDSAYRAARLRYTPTSGPTIDVMYEPPNAPRTGPVLVLNESVDSPAEALRVAQKRLREQNKNFGKASLSVPGDTKLASGLTIDIEDFRRFDGKYIIESVTHVVSSGGYTCNLNIRKVLGW